MGNTPPPPPPPPPQPDYYCPPDYLRTHDAKSSTMIDHTCGNKCDDYDTYGQGINILAHPGQCICACRIDPNSATAQQMNRDADTLYRSLSTTYDAYNSTYVDEVAFISTAQNIVQLPDVQSSYDNMISALTAYKNALIEFNDALTTYKSIPGYTRRSNNSTWINAQNKLNGAVNKLNNTTYPSTKNIYIATKAAAEKAAAEKAAAEAERLAKIADANALTLNTSIENTITQLENGINAEDTAFMKDAVAAVKLSSALPSYNTLLSSWTEYKNAVQSMKDALAIYKTIIGRNRVSTNSTWTAAETKMNTADNTIKTTKYQDNKKAYISAKANAEAADRTANDTLNGILTSYIGEKANTITTAIENEIAGSSQTATTFGVVSSYNDMKTAWAAYKTAYDDVIRSIQTFLAITEKVSALNEYNKIKVMLANSITTAKNTYTTAKTTFNSALIAAQKAARATAWMGTNRPGCRNLVSSSTSVNNIQCNDNEYIYGFKSTDDTYFYTCCDVPKGIVGSGGLPGFDGPIGPQGTRGLQGAKGPQGPQGPQGQQGAQGQQGIKGENIRGPKGPPGKRGKQGAPGPRGNSVELGRDVVIKQIAGPPGIKGVIGPRGPQGVPGLQGPIGPKGKRGRDGKDVDDEEDDEGEYASSPFNRNILRLLDMTDRITNKLS